MPAKAKVLLIGSGAVGTMAAVALERGGKASVTAVCRSNFEAVRQHGFRIDSVEHGHLDGWRPTELRSSVPDVAAEGLQYDYVILSTKNTPDIPTPSALALATPAITNIRTVIVLLQNGLHIEKPFQAAFPENVLLSGVSLISADTPAPGYVRHTSSDRLFIGDFSSPKANVAPTLAAARAADFTDRYNASGVVACTHDPDVPTTRWRKLLYNSSFNPVSAVLRLDTSRLRLYPGVRESLLEPLMREIQAIAGAAGVELLDEALRTTMDVDPLDDFFKPSMLQDAEAGRPMEVENIVGEPLREARRLGVSCPTLEVVYGMVRALQGKVMEERGLMSLEGGGGQAEN